MKFAAQMNRLLPKVLVFTTFFGSCIAIGLVLSALVTHSWVRNEVSFISQTSNATTKNQHGSIKLGLFDYHKALNHGYGLRHENFSVLFIIKSEDDFMNYWLWVLTALGTGLSLFASAVAAVASVIGTIKEKGGMKMMVVSNTVAATGQLIAFICWVLQFFYHFQHNHLLLNADKNRWTSQGQASFGYSFFFIVFAFAIVIINLILLLSAARVGKRYRKSLEPIEEKEGNSIMLY